MNKFLITVIIPSIELEFNVYVPNNKKVGTIKKIILDIAQELSEGIFNKEMNSTLLLDRASGKELDCNKFVKDSEIKNGSKVVII